MKTTIIYMSSHGTTEKIAKMIRAELPTKDIEVINLKTNKKPELHNTDQIILGASIHAGLIPKRMRNFMMDNSQVLKSKKLGLYLCCMEEGEKARVQFENAFPEELREYAKSAKLLGGEFIFEKMNFIERMLVKKIAGTNESISKIKIDEIKKFAKTFI